jgi:hypothetical protein
MLALACCISPAYASDSEDTAPVGMLALPPAALRTAGPTQTLPIPPGFQLKASNGYSLVVLGVPAHKGRAARTLLIVSGKHQEVIYLAPAALTETSIQASLGKLGEVSVTFHPSGQPTTARSKCGGKPVTFDSGSYEGKIDFHGEEGYADAEATSAPGNIDFLLDILCPGIGGGRGSLLPGAELQVRNPGLGAKFSVVKNRPAAPARFEVNASEYRNGISIVRSATLLTPASAFRYDHRLQTAILHPPAPFAGTGQFDRTAKASKRWSGNLTIDMAGRADVPLTGSALRATLAHAEWDHGGK